MLLGKKSTWGNERNRMLAMSLTLLDEETCTSCGTPVWIGHSTDSEIVFDVKSTVCYGCAELEKDRDNRKGKKARKGDIRYVQARNVWEGKPLPSRHDAYVQMSKDEEGE